jgi:2,3-bisphosphoglycerate-independent phosphoglycerate mutase
MLGWTTVERPEFTAALDTDLNGKVAAALEALADHDLVFIHVKGPDICAHDRQPVAKRDFLERLDAALAPLAECGAIVALGSDHTTDSNSGAHTADPVPALLFDPGDSAEAPVNVNFSEKACRRGTQSRTSGAGFLDRLIARLESPA